MICTGQLRTSINRARTGPRPISGKNTVPGVDRLYLVGPFQHPGGGVFGAGRATAMKMCEDLKITFDKIGQAR